MIKTAMILAAGRGKGLKPLTNEIPKPLCKVHGIPLIEHHVINLARAGVHKLIINHAYLGGKIRQHLGSGEQYGVQIIYSPEPPGGFETGGGIVNALPLLGNEPFITVNADIFTDYNFSQLHLDSKNLAHLVLIKKPPFRPFGDFGLTVDNSIENHNKDYTFTGIACYQPALFYQLEPKRFSIVLMLYQLAEDKMATGEVFSGQWSDLGTPERLAQANQSKPT